MSGPFWANEGGTTGFEPRPSMGRGSIVLPVMPGRRAEEVRCRID